MAEIPVVIKITTQETGGATRILDSLARGATALESASSRASRRLAEVEAALNRTGRSGANVELAKVESQLEDIAGTGKESVAVLKELNENLKNTKPPAQGNEDFLGGFVKSATVAATATAALKTVATATIDLEAELATLNTIVELNDDQLAEYGESLSTLSLELGTNTGAVQNTQAAYQVASGGFISAADNADVLSATLKAATAGNEDAARSAKLIGGTLKAYGLEASEAERVSDIFFTTVKNGITTFPELSATIGNVTGIASQAGISLEEINAALATTTTRGIRTATSVDGLRGLITNLIAPTDQAKKELARLGVEVDENTVRQKGLLQTLQEISAANGNSAASFKTIVGDVQAFNVALALVNDGGDLFAQNIERTENALGATNAALEQKAKSLQFSIDQFKVATEAAAGAVGQSFLPAGKALLDIGTGIITTFVNLPGPIRTFIGVTGTAAVASAGAAAAINLITTAAQRETIALALNRAAKIANTTVTLAGARATAVATAALVRKNAVLAVTTVRTAAASLSLAGLSTASLGVAASLGPLLLAGGAIIALAYETAEAWTDAAEALDDYTDAAAKSSAQIGTAFRSTRQSVEELREVGKTAKDLETEIKALLQAGENVRQLNLAPEDEAARLATISKGLQDLREKKIQLAELEKADAERAKNQTPTSVAAPVDDEAAKAAEKARKERLAAELSRIDVLKNRRELSAQQEIDALNKVLETFKINASERRQIEERVAKLIGDTRAKAEKEAANARKKNLSDTLKEAAAIPEAITKNQGGTQAAVKAYDDAIVKVEMWRQKNRELLKQFPEIGKEAEKAVEKLRADRIAAETKRTETNLKAVRDQITGLGKDAQTSGDKLAAIDKGITLVKQAQRRGTITQAQAERELTELGRERLGVEQTITQQKLRQAGETNQLEIEGIQQEIDFLELKKQAGIDVENELIAKRQERHEAQLRALDIEKRAELEGANDKEAVEEKFQLKVRNLERQRTLDLKRETNKRLDIVKQPSTQGQESSSPSSGSQSSADQAAASDPSFFKINFSGIRGLSDDERAARKQERESGVNAKRQLDFEAANPGLLDRIREQDAERARKISASSADPRLSDPFGERQVSDVTTRVNEAARSRKPDAQAQTAGSEASSSQSQTVTNNNQRVTINVEGGKTVSLTETQKRQVLDVVDEAQKRNSLFGQ